MVTRIYGMIDGIEVQFQKMEEGLYKVEFPRKLESGNYIVEVYAEDDAGNKSYCSTMICTIDASGTCIHLENYSKYKIEKLENEKGISYIQNIPKLYLMDHFIHVIQENTYVYLEAIPPAKCRGGIA